MNITKEIGDKSIAKFGHITKGIAYYIIDTDFAKYIFPISISKLNIVNDSEAPKELRWIDMKSLVIEDVLNNSFIRVPKNSN